MGKRKAGQETPSNSEGRMSNVPRSVRDPNAGGRKGNKFRQTLEKTTKRFRPKKIVEEVTEEEFKPLPEDEQINLKVIPEVVAEEKPEEEHAPVVDPEPEPKMIPEVVAEEKPEEEHAPVVDPEPELKKKKKKRKKNKNKVADGVEAGPADSTDDDVPRCPLTSCIIL